MIAVLLIWAARSGGYFPTDWYPGGLFLAALLVLVALVARAGFSPPHGLRLVALLALAAFTAWSFLSIAWADAPGDAWEAANRSALYCVIFALFTTWRWDAPAALGLLASVSVGVCAIGLAAIAGAARSSDPGASFVDGRFAEPIGYPNGNAALFLLGFWPALVIGSRREVPALARAALLGVAAALAELALLSQSRGAAVAFAVTAVLAAVVLPGRLRLLVATIPVAAAVAVAAPVLLDVASAADLATASRRAATAVALSSVGALVAGLVLAFADRRVRVPPRLHLWAGRAAVAAAAVVALVVVVSLGNPVTRVERAWDSLTTPTTDFEGRVGFGRGLETNRGDLWRVALHEFRAHPLQGIGAGNFAIPYLQQRRSEEETLYPHSLPLEVLAQTGLVGAAAMVVFVAAAVAAAVAVRSRTDGLTAVASALGVVVFASWFVHAAIDWLWQLPALAGTAIAALALAGSIRPPDAASATARATRAPKVAAVAVAIAVSLTFAFPWLAARDVEYALASWRSQPDAADAALSRARRLDPLSERPDLVAALIARERGDWQAMGAAAARAIDRSEGNWYAHLQLALSEVRQGHRERAGRQLTQAVRLNPSEPILVDLRRQVARGEPVDLDQVARSFRERYEVRVR